MKISDIKVHALGVKKIPALLGFPELQINFNLLRVFTDEGIEGNFMTQYIRAESLAEVVKFLKPFLIGEDPFYREKIWQRVYELGQMNVGVGLGFALSAIDIALWDIAGKALKIPIYKLLGGYKDKVRAYASTITYPSVKHYTDHSIDWIERGYTAIKLHAWGDLKKDIEVARAVRGVVGEDVCLMFDGCSVYNREEALKMGRELDKLGYEWYEDPMPNMDIDGYAKLARTLDTPLKVGEGVGDWIRGSSINIIYEYIRRNATDIVGAMGDAIGGITAMRKIADVSEAACIRYEPHNHGSTLVQAAHFHIELASKNCHFFELPVPEGLLDVGMKDTFRIDNKGNVHAPTKPGLGVEVDWEEIAKLTLKVY